MSTPVQLVKTSFSQPSEVPVKTPPKHKVTLVIWTAIFPTVLLLSTLLSLLPFEIPRVLSVFIITVIAVPAAVYIIVPRLYRLLDPWVNREPRAAKAGAGGAIPAFLRFNSGILGMSTPVRLWLLLMAAANMVVPLFFLGRVEAQVVLATFLAGIMLMTALTAISGFTRLLGLGHVFWIPMLWFLWTRLDATPSDTGFGLWLRVLITLNALSLVIDTADVVRYIAGEREETVEGLT